MPVSLLVLSLVLPLADPDTAVVCPAEFREALAPWLEHRRGQGHRIELLSSTPPKEEIRREIRRLARPGRLRFVVLVGDAEPAMAVHSGVRARCVPVHRARAEVNVAWGSEPHIATDNWYADLDDDGVPDVAVGRLTPDTPEELALIVRKILSYERSGDFGDWRRRLNFVAGVGGFGPLADAMLESAATSLLTHDVPADYRVSMTYGSWRSPYCPDPRSFHLTTLQRLNEGCWFWVYLGHGYHVTLDRIRVPDAEYHILANPDVAKLDCRRGAPIALFLACYSGAFDARQDCLAEEMLRTPGGPVAVLAGSRVTMPYAMTVLGLELIEALFERRCPTLGEAILEAKRNMVRPSAEAGADRAVLDVLSAALSGVPAKLAAERAEHVRLFNLIGDPMLRLRHPRKVTLEMARSAEAGDLLEVTGTSPVDGRATVELVVRRDRLTFQPPERSTFPRSSRALAEFQQVYRRANDARLASAELAVEGGRFHAELAVPPGVRGPCHVRVFVESSDDFAQGAADVTIGPWAEVSRR